MQTVRKLPAWREQHRLQQVSGKTPLVLLPGLMCTGAVWKPVIDQLGDAIIAEPMTNASLESVTALAEETLRYAPARFALAGHSFGGYVALAIMRLAPDRVSHLVLVASSARADNDQQRSGRDQMIRSAQAGNYATIPPRMAPVLLGPSRQNDAALLEQLRDMAASVGPEALVAHLKAAKGRPDSFDILPNISVPTLVAGGKQDRVTPPSEQEALATPIPGATLLMLKDCGHMMPLEQPNRLAAAIRAHLD